MEPRQSSMDEVRLLVDRFYDGQASQIEIERMATLVAENQGCLQAYVERLDFHCKLVEQSEIRTPRSTIVRHLQHHDSICIQRQNRTHRNFVSATVAGLTLLVVGVIACWMVAMPGHVAVVAGLSADFEANSTPIELTQLIQKGQTVSVAKGILSLELPDITLNLIGPAEARFESQNLLFLSSGTAVVLVQPGGIGFTVTTPAAKVVDLGTEFRVEHSLENGTLVSVRRGAAHASLLDWRGHPTKSLELTAARAASFQQSTGDAQEIEYDADQYLPIDRSRGGIRRLTGELRTVSEVPATLQSNQITTPNHMLVIPEQQQVVLESAITVEGVSGQVTIPAGTTVSSYLIHYDPTLAANAAPRGSVTFRGEIGAVIGSTPGLVNTDPLFGLPETVYETEAFRELELEKDEVHLSDDRKTVSFFLSVSYPKFLDEARILVIEKSP